MRGLLRPTRIVALLLAIWSVSSSAPCAAATISFDVSFPSWPGALAPGTPVALLFDFVDGSGTGDGNNTVLIDEFLFGGGVAGAATVAGGGSTTSGPLQVTLVDTSFLNSVRLPFTSGAALSFHVTLSSNADGAQPDQFALFLLDDAGNPFPTTDPFGTNALLAVDLMSGLSLNDIQLFSNLDAPGIGAPSLENTSAVPEPATITCMLVGMVGLRLSRRRGSPHA